MKKRILSFVLCLCLTAALIPGTVGAVEMSPFRDVKTSDWFYDGVQYTYENGMMTGTGSDKFSPNETTTRGMIVTILHRLEGMPYAGGAVFSDVSSGKWYFDAVSWASSKGIVTGYGNGTFGPEDKITREQLAAILYRYADYKGYDVSVNASLSNYTDAVQINSYAVESMAWANAAGLITGTTSTTLSPKGSATRAQVATILMRFCVNIADVPDAPEKDDLSRINYYDASGTLIYYESYAYYDNGRLCSTTLHSVSYYSDYSYAAGEYTFLYLYDDNGNLTKTVLDALTTDDSFNRNTGAVTFHKYQPNEVTIYPAKESINQKKFGVDPTKTKKIYSDAPVVSTDTANGWASTYLRDVFDGSMVTDMTSCRLIYVDNNTTPELWMDYSYGYAGARVYTAGAGTTDYVYINHGTAYWIEKNNILYTTGGHMDVYNDTVYQIQNGRFVTIAQGDFGFLSDGNYLYDEYEYYWNGVEVTEREYDQNVANAFDMSKATDINQNIYTYEQCKLLLQSIQ